MDRAQIVVPMWVAAGAAIGGVMRYWCSGVIARLAGETFPLGTLFVNVTGSFLIVLVAELTGPEGRLLLGSAQRQFIMTGIFGGFTTFSSWSLQTLALIQDGQWFHAAANVLLSVTLCLIGAWAGYAVGVLINR